MLISGAGSIVDKVTGLAALVPYTALRVIQRTTPGTFDARSIVANIDERRCVVTKYEFSLILEGSPELTEDLADQLFAAGCDDGSPGTCNGVFTIDFHREAATLEAAIQSAIANVRDAGQTVARVEIEADLIALPA